MPQLRVDLGADDEARRINGAMWQEGRQALAINPETICVAFRILCDLRGFRNAHGGQRRLES